MNSILKEYLERIFANINSEAGEFRDSNIFITGCCGFLGYYFLNFFNTFKEVFGISSIVAVDKFQVGKPDWLSDILQDGNVDLQEFDIIDGDLSSIEREKSNSFVVHNVI